MRRVRVATAAFLLLALLFASRPASAQPDEVKLGIYVTGLSGFNLGTGTFNVDFWLWSLTRSGTIAPLDTIDIVNSVARQSELAANQRFGDLNWSQQRLRVTARTEFLTHDFPFDRQKIHIVFEDSLSTTKTMIYAADRQNSGFSPNLTVPGWTVRGWDVTIDDHVYTTTFGHPEHKDSTPASRLTFSLDIQRHGWADLLELALGAFVAFSIMALSFRMNPTVPPIFAGRMGVIVASVFTAVLSLRSADTAMGLPMGTTLVDRLHILTLAAGFVAAIGAAAVRQMAESGNEAAALRTDRWTMPVFVAAYLVVAAVLIAHALPA